MVQVSLIRCSGLFGKRSKTKLELSSPIPAMQSHNTDMTYVCTSLDVAGTFYSSQTTPLQQNKKKELHNEINYLWTLSAFSDIYLI